MEGSVNNLACERNVNLKIFTILVSQFWYHNDKIEEDHSNTTLRTISPSNRSKQNSLCP